MSGEVNENQYVSYPMFKGLQKPLEFMGFQGRYITWAACAVGGAILGFIIAYCILGFVVGLVVLAVSLCSGAALIFFCFLGVLIFSTLQFGSRFSRRRS